MRCGEAKQLMLLYRERELPGDTREKLARHIARCPECSAEEKLISGEFAPLDTLRMRQPVLADPEGLTMQIMRQIDIGPVRPRAADYGVNIAIRMLARTRPALATAGAVLLVLFIALTAYDARSVASFEARLRYSGGKELSYAEKLAIDAGDLLDDRASRRYAEAGMGSGDAVHAIESILHGGTPSPHITMEEYLLRKYPGLASVTLQDGIDDKERAVLAGEGTRFLRELDSLIRKETPRHEQ
jgi:hypothetical protein